jgi:heat shock protein HtpX
MTEPRLDTTAYPMTLTFGELIARNNRNTALLVVGMGALTVAVVMALAALAMSYGGGRVSPQGLVASLIVSVGIVTVGAAWSYYAGAGAILSISGAREIQRAGDPQLFNVVEELAIAGGVPVPRIHLIDSDALNAFATGRDPAHAAVAVTTGLRARLTRDELQGVLAHELAHVRHYDIRLTMMVATMVGLIVMASDLAWRSLYYGRGGSRRSSGDDKGGGAAMLILVVVVVLLAILAPLMAKIMQLAVSRQREYLADAGAVELSRNPRGLIDALKKLGGDDHQLPQASRATAHLYIVNPFHAAKGELNLDSMFSTHPPLSERIARLEALMR